MREMRVSQESQGLVAGMERHQVAIYVGALAAGAVAGWVTQTLVEVVGMVIYVRAVPRLLPAA